MYVIRLLLELEDRALRVEAEHFGKPAATGFVEYGDVVNGPRIQCGRVRINPNCVPTPGGAGPLNHRSLRGGRSPVARGRDSEDLLVVAPGAPAVVADVSCRDSANAGSVELSEGAAVPVVDVAISIVASGVVKHGPEFPVEVRVCGDGAGAAG